jgi:hypothetical protein
MNPAHFPSIFNRGYLMQAKPLTRYDLNDVHKAIDLYDRKIAYCKNFEVFDSEQARATALQKLVTKRESLVKTAAEAASRGITSDPKYLPRSFKQATAAKAA